MSTETITMTILTSGVEVPRSLAATVVLVLESWMDSPLPGPLLAYDAAMMARDASYTPFGRNGEALSEAGFIDMSSGRLHRSIADIVKCSVVGDGLDMRLVNPVAEDQAE